MSFRNTIYTALAADIGAYFGAASLPVLYPGVGGNPPDTGNWVDFRFFLPVSANYGLSDDGPTVVRGFFRLGIAGKPGLGVVPQLEIADDAAAEFKKGYVIDAATNTRIYQEAEQNSILEEDDRVVVPLTFRFTGTLIHPVGP